MGKVQFEANEPLVDVLKSLMVLDDISMAEVIRRSIETQHYFKTKILHGHQVIIRDFHTDEETIVELR